MKPARVINDLYSFKLNSPKSSYNFEIIFEYHSWSKSLIVLTRICARLSTHFVIYAAGEL